MSIRPGGKAPRLCHPLLCALNIPPPLFFDVGSSIPERASTLASNLSAWRRLPGVCDTRPPRKHRVMPHSHITGYKPHLPVNSQSASPTFHRASRLPSPDRDRESPPHQEFKWTSRVDRPRGLCPMTSVKHQAGPAAAILRDPLRVWKPTSYVRCSYPARGCSPGFSCAAPKSQPGFCRSSWSRPWPSRPVSGNHIYGPLVASCHIFLTTRPIIVLNVLKVPLRSLATEPRYGTSS